MRMGASPFFISVAKPARGREEGFGCCERQQSLPLWMLSQENR
jgi:hypothetical protein